MSTLQNILTIVLACGGLFLMLAGSIGLLRLPDFYTRTHATSKVDTLGVMLILLAFAVYEGTTLTAAKLVLGMVFIALANPIASHALARAAFRLGLHPWKNSTIDPRK